MPIREAVFHAEEACSHRFRLSLRNSKFLVLGVTRKEALQWLHRRSSWEALRHMSIQWWAFGLGCEQEHKGLCWLRFHWLLFRKHIRTQFVSQRAAQPSWSSGEQKIMGALLFELALNLHLQFSTWSCGWVWQWVVIWRFSAWNWSAKKGAGHGKQHVAQRTQLLHVHASGIVLPRRCTIACWNNSSRRIGTPGWRSMPCFRSWLTGEHASNLCRNRMF